MKWFKHITSSATDEKLSRVMDEMGLEGYGFYWRILEIIASQMDETGRTSCEYSPKVWGKFVGFNSVKFSKVAQLLAEIGLFFVEIREKSIIINCPNLLKYKDEYASRKIKNRDNIGIKSGECPEQEGEGEGDKEGDIKEPPISPVPGDCDGEPAKADDPPKPEAVPAIPAGMLYHTPGEQERREQAKAIIADLNTRCGKSFPDTGGILSVILERLREGRHPPEFEKIITNKLADPHFQANPSLYTPNTLFRATHFDQYLSEKPSEYNTGGKNGGRDYQSGRKRHIAERPIEEQAKPHGEEAFWVGTDPGESSGARP